MEITLLVYLLSCCAVLVTSEKIIIIGAGASGISAATRLIENNVTDFRILEAETRLGGRIHSILLKDREKDVYVDLGGEYVGGEEGNVVYEFARGALHHSDDSRRRKAFYSDGKSINETFSEKILEFRANLRSWYEDKKPISTADAFLRDSIPPY
ncbi:hypothetical protein WA026_022594 [Henosepilachna vigintioctopunctata]|uniref:Amine oxidase domain-containing protein n=1 Tax=Henosepilachna vigintioctopunctata TaxID=420089 RepID=A0AAW1V3S4_9CUCU